MRSKKGAIEMSMTTIIIIIIGVVILSLGLVFVQQIFSKSKILTENTFEKAEKSIVDFGKITEPLTITSDKIDLELGKNKVVEVILANLEEKDLSGIKAAVSVPDKFKNDINCIFLDTESATSESYSIKSGKAIPINMRIESKEGGKLGSKSCKIVASGFSNPTQDTISITIIA